MLTRALREYRCSKDNVINKSLSFFWSKGGRIKGFKVNKREFLGWLKS